MRQVAGLVVVIVAGCSPRFEEATLSAASNLMVGSTATGSVSYEKCDEMGASCQSITIELDSVTIEPAGVFSLEVQRDSFHYKALRPGTATLDVEDDDGDVFHRTLTAAVPDYIKVDVECPSGVSAWDQSLGTTRAFGPNSEVPVTFEIFAESLSSYPLQHDASIVPIEAPLLTVKDDPTVAGHGKVVFMTGATPATGSITSPYDARVAFPLVVLAPGDATGFRFRASDPIPLGQGIGVAALLTIGNDQLTCKDDFARTVRTLTPETCLLRDGTQMQAMLAVPGRGLFAVAGVAAGTCTIEVALDGTATTHQQSFTVAP